MSRQQAHRLLNRLGPAQFLAVAQLLEVLASIAPPGADRPPGRYYAPRNGDVKKLKTTLTGLRLRFGHYRLFFDFEDPATIEITGVRPRDNAYQR